MANKIQKIWIGGVLYTLLFAGAAQRITGSDDDTKCGGKELWDIKVLNDNNAGAIQNTPDITTIEDILEEETESLKRKKINGKEQRLKIEEKLVTVKNALIRKIILEDDNDYHLVIQDREGNHMIAEIVDPDCPDAQESEYIDDYYLVREKMWKYRNNFQHYEFDITGVLFKDRFHNQTGAAKNNLEIHPVLKLKAVKKLNYEQ